MLSFFPRDVLDEIWDLIGSVSEGFPTYFFRLIYPLCLHNKDIFHKDLTDIREIRIYFPNNKLKPFHM